ncbi:MAG TPA: lysylphosphatidylglycerol synthase transmembrane domain-containing protein [Longimicrobium sp.]|nr:lysylphosphatidylglycerol synthase transmembrane domain-containing protein [Longimicrobium sp.]
MSLLLACVLCTALMVADLFARAARLRWFLRGAGATPSLGAICVAILFSDAAAAVTPMRLGGEPARWLGLRSAGVPGGAAVAVLAVEMVSYMAVVAFTGAATAWLMGAEWWAAVGPRLAARAGEGVPWAAAVVAASAAVWVCARRGRAGRAPAAAQAPAVAALRGAIGWPLAASVPLTVASIAARLAVLPVLAQALPAPPPLGVLVLGSFALTYGQLFFPTPGGAGAVELLASAGTAGELGGTAGPVFVAWRAITTGLPVVAGFALAVHSYGGAAVRNALRGQRPADLPQVDAVELA